MPKIEQRVLKHDVCQAEQALATISQTYGKQSSQYRDALVRFARLWSILKMTRRQEEFYPDIKR